ncbi:AAEL004020-PA [Aedes aegypti]|uniref:AAEL004020-PA n=1 Tax=Aedes aegypti TaxID=7159 RepID=Q17DY5_AEDAE|nr:AAEL004020-PA [Aedes aegypti]
MNRFLLLLALGTFSIGNCLTWEPTENERELVSPINQTNVVYLDEATSTKVLSRRKRFVVFPEGSSFSVAACMTVGVYGNPNYQMFSWAMNWGIAYNLPNQTFSFQSEMMEPKPMAQRRHRRDLYQKLEVAMNDMGYSGRECVLRALCESSQYFGKKGSNMVAEMLRTLFSYPKSKVLSFEHSDHRIYDEAHRKGRNKVLCQSMYPTCGFSLLELALGKYSSPFSSFM